MATATPAEGGRLANLPFSKKLVSNLSNITQLRHTLLPNLNYLAKGGRQTRIEVHETLAALANPVLRRIDFATGTLAWVDSNSGAARLVSQRALAEEAGRSRSAVSRLFARLEEAGYCTRRIRLIPVKMRGLLWNVRTEVCLTFTDAFFDDLGVGKQWRKLREWAQRRRRKQIEVAKSNAAREAERQRKKKTSFAAWKTRTETELAREHDMMAKLHANRLLAKAVKETPGLTPQEARVLVEREIARWKEQQNRLT